MDGTISTLILPNLLRHNVGVKKDMISDLPESVLSSILSFLSTEEAVRTSILATKWRYLWTHLSVFNFECLSRSKSSRKRADCLVDLLDKLFEKSNSLEIEKLCIKLQGNIFDKGKVSSMLSSVLMHKVHDLQLLLPHTNTNASFVLPNSFSASKSLNKLYIEFGILDSVPDGICFPSLKILDIAHLTFTNKKSAQRLLSGCPVLQELTLHKCYWVNIKPFRVAIPTLKKLTVHFKSSDLDDNSCRIEIDAVNLSSLSYTSNPSVNCFLVNSTSIVDANIDLAVFYPQSEPRVAAFTIGLLIRLRSVEYLRLSEDTLQRLNYAKPALHQLPSFNNLTHLEVLLGYPSCEVLADILHMTPNLEVLHIYRGFYLALFGGEWTSDSLPCCFKSSLKLCSISDFCGVESEIQLVKFLLENVTFLRKMNIFCAAYLSDYSDQLADVRNQLQPLGRGNCVINLSTP